MEASEEKESSYLLLLEEIGEVITRIEEQIEPVLRGETETDSRVAEATSPVRDKLGGILTRLNILSSRIDS